MTTDFNQLRHDDGDEEFREMLAPLRRLGPSQTGQTANRRAIAGELTRLPAIGSARPARSSRWRSFAGLACSLAAGIGIGWFSRGPVNAESPAPSQTHADANRSKDAREPALAASDNDRPFTFYAQETYLCGVGRLSSNYGYSFQE